MYFGNEGVHQDWAAMAHAPDLAQALAACKALLEHSWAYLVTWSHGCVHAAGGNDVPGK